MPTNYDPIETPKSVEDITILVYLMTRKEMTCLCSFRNPAIYDSIQLRVQIFWHKLGDQSGEGGRQLGRLEHAGIARRDGPHL
jgi:hypothetical protein